MFNLTESFKKGYELFLQEQTDAEFERAFAGLEESQKEAEESFTVLSEYFNLYAKANNLLENPRLTPSTGTSGGVRGTAGPENSSGSDSGSGTSNRGGTGQGSGMNRRDEAQEENVVSSLIKVLSKISDISTEEDIRRDTDYRPITGAVEVTKVSEMKFPENIIFFIKSLVSWLINVVRKFISIFTNVIRKFFGLSEGEETVTARDLTMKLAKSKEIATISSLVPYGNARDNIKPIQLLRMPIENIERVDRLINDSVQEKGKYTFITEAELLERDGDEGSAESREKGYYLNIENEQDRKKAQQLLGIQSKEKTFSLVQIDLSKDLENLEQLISHFFDLFENAYGSNNEHLFETGDLEILLRLFNDTIDQITSGRLSSYAVDGKLSPINTLDASNLKNNLMRTHVNTEKLKEVYVEIQKRIQNVLMIIGHKQLIAAEGMGLKYKFYSASTYQVMIQILNVITPRIKDVVRIEKGMNDFRRRFETLTVRLGRLRQGLQGFGEIVYQSQYQKRINDLFEGARYVTQTISLRLATVGLYLRQLRDIREGISNLNQMNVSGGRAVRRMFNL
jgi:hypothetical protein